MMAVFKKTFPFVSLSERTRKLTAKVVFWLWNVLVLCLIFFGLVPHVLVEIVRDAARGLIPWNLTLAILCLTVLPLLSVAWGIRLFQSAGKLMALFYGLEVPLGLVCLLRIFLIRELTGAMTFVAVAFFVSSAAFAYELARQPGNRPWGHVARLCGQSVAAVTGLYLAAILSFYAPVVAVAAAKGFFGFAWLAPLFQVIVRGHILLALVALLFALSAALFVAAPIALVVLYSRSFLRVYGRCRAQIGGLSTRLAAALTALAMVGTFVALNRQPHRRAFERLSRLPTSDAERTQLLEAAGDIRKGLVEAYLSPYRFLSARGENNHLSRLYAEVLGCPSRAAAVVESAQDGLLAPFLYDGDSMTADQRRAEQLYADFFDTPLQRRERTRVLSALAATWNRDQRAAGLLNQDQRQVKLTRQDVRVEESGTAAVVEIHDRYENQTSEIQEIFISFSLPESAVVTGLWLGESDDRDKRFAFKVSPRGAAQKVYRAEVARRADPALVEQVGPGQYRLRTFPIPAKPHDGGPAPAFHLWLTYVAHAQAGRWPTPLLSERRNVYWDGSTERHLGQALIRREQDEWVGLDLPAKGIAADLVEEAVLPGGHLVRREPLHPEQLVSPSGGRFAVVVDRSYSMGAVRDELQGTLSGLAALGRQNDIDCYFSSASSRGEPAAREDDMAVALRKPLLFFGGGSLKQWLRQMDALRADTTYDAVFVLTDGDTLDGSDDSQPPDMGGAALWIIHLGGRLAPGYDDPTIDLVNRSGGGVTTTFEAAILRHAAHKVSGSIIGVEGKSLWTVRKTDAPETPVDNFARLAARQLILALGRDATDLAALDEIQGLAVKYGEVSAYSSMVVLVDDAQRRALAETERQADRFNRAFESGKEVLPTPTNPFALSATPEPHEWILIGLAVAAAAFVIRQRRRVAVCA